jgi:FtsZ-binding cell division protein ZapB
MTNEQHVKALTKKIVECVSTIDTLKAEIRSLRMELQNYHSWVTAMQEQGGLTPANEQMRELFFECAKNSDRLWRGKPTQLP